MADAWVDNWSDSFEDEVVTPPPPVTSRPRLVIEMSLDQDVTTDDGPGTFTLGTSYLDGPDVLGGVVWEPLDPDRFVSCDITPGSTAQFAAASPGTLTLVAENWDGLLDPLNTSGPYYGRLDIGQQIRVTAVDDATGTVYPRARMQIDDIDCDYGREPTATFTCSDALAALGGADLPETAPVFDGDPTGQRINRLLDSALWPTSRRKIAAGTIAVAGETYGSSVLSLVQRIVDTELGSLFVDPDGDVVFYDRLQVFLGARSTAVQAVLSDAGGVDDIEYDDLAGRMGQADIYTRATATRAVDGATPQTYVDTAVEQRRGILAFGGEVGTMARNDADAYAAAQWVVARYSTPRMRFPELPIDATTQGQWSTLLGLRRFDRVSFHRTYGPGLTVDREVLVEGVKETITSDRWVMVLTVRDAEGWTPFMVGTSFIDGPDLLI